MSFQTATVEKDAPYNVPMLVLASASPRRQELLRNAGIPFEVQPTQIAEDPLPGEGAKECAERLAREKALAIARQRPQDVVLGADTVVVIDARNSRQARRCRRRRPHAANAFGAGTSGDYRRLLSGRWTVVGGQ